MTIDYSPKGVCSGRILIEISDDGTVGGVDFMGGCGGNAQGIAHLVKGMKADEVIRRLENIDCGRRGTSCPDQLARALKTWRAKAEG